MKNESQTKNGFSSEQINISIDSPRILAIGDVHFPFCDREKVLKLYSYVKQFKPNVIVQIGDLYDMYTFSKFSRSVDLITPAEEIRQGKSMAEAFWRNLQRNASPGAKCFQLRGNHSARIVKRLLEKAPEYESLLHEPISKLTEFDNVRDMKSHRSELTINDIVFVHGWSCKLGFHMNYYGKSVVCGHSHHGGLVYKSQKLAPLFELNCGHIADENALPLQYGETQTTNWVGGFGWIDAYGPRFIHL
jgi:UDP-2,3-diacylglucosamine pyrophosphatase LpxH